MSCCSFNASYRIMAAVCLTSSSFLHLLTAPFNYDSCIRSTRCLQPLLLCCSRPLLIYDSFLDDLNFISLLYIENFSDLFIFVSHVLIFGFSLLSGRRRIFCSSRCARVSLEWIMPARGIVYYPRAYPLSQNFFVNPSERPKRIIHRPRPLGSFSISASTFYFRSAC